MEDLQKDQAIFQAMSEIANKVFVDVMQTNEGLKTLLKEYGGFISLSDICKEKHEFTKNFFIAMRDACLGERIHIVEVDTFSCSFPSCQVFDLLKYWKSLAKVKCEQVFMYEERIDNDFMGSVEVTIPDATNAKLITKHCAKSELRPILDYVVAEINATTQSIDFVASDGHTLCVISNNPAQVFAKSDKPQTIFQAVFTPDDWKRICDYAKKNKGHVLFDIYRKKEQETFDTFGVHIGDIVLRSSLPCGRFPNWKSVIPSPDDLKHRFNIVPEEWRDAQEWMKKLKGKEHLHVNVSFYRGSDLVYFDYEDYDFSKTKTATFHLTRPSSVTIGACYSIRAMLKLKFTGFNIEDTTHATLVNCEEADIMVVMPCEGYYVRDAENREVLETVEVLKNVEETAMVVEMAEAA